MNADYIFRMWIQNQAVFEHKNGFFVNRYLDESHVAVGLFSSSSTGFLPVDDAVLYASVDQAMKVNRNLEVIQIIGIQDRKTIVAMQFQGNYEYFALQDIQPDDVSDDLIHDLAAGIDLNRESSFEKPYMVTFKAGKVWAVK